jgi:hypothetical protein
VLIPGPVNTKMTDAGPDDQASEEIVLNTERTVIEHGFSV